MITVYFTELLRPLPDKRLREIIASFPVDLQDKIKSYRRWEDGQACLVSRLQLLEGVIGFELAVHFALDASDLLGEGFDDGPMRFYCQRNVRIAQQWPGLGLFTDQHFVRDLTSLLPCVGALHIQDVSRSLLHQSHALTQQIAQCALFFGIYVPGGQNTQSQQVCKLKRIVPIIRMLQPIVLTNRTGVHQLQRVT